MQARALRRSVEQLEQTGRETLGRFGIEADFGNRGFGKGANAKGDPVVDVGPPIGLGARLPMLVKKGVQGLLLGTSFALLGFALLSLGMLTAAAALAFVFITRGLGLRIDMNRPAATS